MVHFVVVDLLHAEREEEKASIVVDRANAFTSLNYYFHAHAKEIGKVPSPCSLNNYFHTHSDFCLILVLN
jgi:hypothetical protein